MRTTDGITEFLSSINIWLAFALVIGSIFLVWYSIMWCILLIKNEISPKEYTERNDYFRQEYRRDPYYELYEGYEADFER